MSLYDPLGRLLSETWMLGDEQHTMDYVYDGAGRYRSITYPGGSTVTYEYDTAGRLARVCGGLDCTGVQHAVFDYHWSGFMNRIAFANGAVTMLTSDPRLRRSAITTQVGETGLTLFDIARLNRLWLKATTCGPGCSVSGRQDCNNGAR